MPDPRKPYWRVTFVGQTVGEATAVPRYHSLRECEDCQSTIWIDQDGADLVTTEVPPIRG
jgi:hypothetical protein